MSVFLFMLRLKNRLNTLIRGCIPSLQRKYEEEKRERYFRSTISDIYRTSDFALESGIATLFIVEVSESLSQSVPYLESKLPATVDIKVNPHLLPGYVSSRVFSADYFYQRWAF